MMAGTRPPSLLKSRIIPSPKIQNPPDLSAWRARFYELRYAITDPPVTREGDDGDGRGRVKSRNKSIADADGGRSYGDLPACIRYMGLDSLEGRSRWRFCGRSEMAI